MFQLPPLRTFRSGLVRVSGISIISRVAAMSSDERAQRAVLGGWCKITETTRGALTINLTLIIILTLTSPFP